MLKYWPPGLSWTEIDLQTYLVWVQIPGLPMERSNALIAKHIGAALGQVLAIDGRVDQKVWCVPFLRVRVLMHASHPLLTGYNLPRENLDSLLISFKYKRLTGFCYLCGLLGHM